MSIDPATPHAAFTLGLFIHSCRSSVSFGVNVRLPNEGKVEEETAEPGGRKLGGDTVDTGPLCGGDFCESDAVRKERN